MTTTDFGPPVGEPMSAVRESYAVGYIVAETTRGALFAGVSQQEARDLLRPLIASVLIQPVGGPPPDTLTVSRALCHEDVRQATMRVVVAVGETLDNYGVPG